jgi:hypothetical protein
MRFREMQTVSYIEKVVADRPDEVVQAGADGLCDVAVVAGDDHRSEGGTRVDDQDTNRSAFECDKRDRECGNAVGPIL